MQQRRRQTVHSRSMFQSDQQPELKKRTLTMYAVPDSIHWMDRIKTSSTSQEQYAKLTMNSVNNRFPVSQLKPYSTFYPLQTIHNQIQTAGENLNTEPLKTTDHSRKSSLFDKIFSLNASTKGPSHNSTFYQTKRNKRKNNIRFHTTINLANSKPDEEQRMVIQFIKDDKQVKKKQKSVFQAFNEKVKTFYPKHFEPNLTHQQQKCKSKSCNEGFFKRKKYCVEQKYEVDQPGFEQPKLTKKNDKKQNTHQNNNFYVFSKSKNRIVSTQKNIPAHQEQKDGISDSDMKQLSISMKEKYKARSAVYKKYMRSSFKQKKKALAEDLNIKIA